MRTIEIATSQNVTIQFNLATAGQRILGFILDLIIISLSVILVMFLLGSFFNNEDYLLFLIMIPVSFYSLWTEYFFNGATPGKRIAGIKVVKLDGSEPELIDYFGRWSTRLIDLWFSGGAIALIMVSTTNHAQRLGDILSGTVVVKTKSESTFKLKDILKLKDAEGYEARFPEVRQFTEKEMVMIKRLIDRYEDYPNDANLRLVEKAADRARERMRVTEALKPDVKFLRTLIRDFVILSR